MWQLMGERPDGPLVGKHGRRSHISEHRCRIQIRDHEDDDGGQLHWD